MKVSQKLELVNPKLLTEDYQNELKDKFDNAIPFKHLVIDDFLRKEVADKLYSKFPSIQSLNVKRKSMNENKSEDYHFERWDAIFTQVKEELSSPKMTQILTKITGIEDLYVTPDNSGCGIHQGANGSFVDVHVDFNLSTTFNAWRRINLLIYLNKDWKDSYGGNLELWDTKMTKCYHKVAPLINRAVIFQTDDVSLHGVDKVTVPEGETRKSFYTYYYTDVNEGFKYRDSKFFSRPDDSIQKKMVVGVKENLKVRIKRTLFNLGFKNIDFQDKNKK